MFRTGTCAARAMRMPVAVPPVSRPSGVQQDHRVDPAVGARALHTVDDRMVAPVQRPRAPPALLPRRVVRGDDRLRDRLLFVVEHHGVRTAQPVVPVPRQVDRPRLPWRPGRERLLVGARDGVVDAGLEHGDRAAGHHAPDVPAAALAAALGPPVTSTARPTWCPRRLPPRPRSPVLRPPPGPESPRSRGPSAFITICVTACCNRKPGTHPAVDRQPAAGTPDTRRHRRCVRPARAVPNRRSGPRSLPRHLSGRARATTGASHLAGPSVATASLPPAADPSVSPHSVKRRAGESA